MAAPTHPPVLWVDDRLVEADQPVLLALDHGVTVGDGVFETCAVVDGVPFALTRHLRRLARSAEGLGLEPPPEPRVRAALAAVLDRLGDAPAARLRLTWTAGPGPLGSDRSPGEGTLIVAGQPSAPWAADPVAVSVPWTRNERSAVAGLKTTSYAENVVALARARQEGGQEALLGNTRGELCEGTGSNVWVVAAGELLTPPLTSGCLAGITRELLLEWGRREGLPVRETPLPMGVLATCEDVLLTSSTRDVQPQHRLDGRVLPRGALAREAVAVFARCAAAEPDPL